MVTPCSPSSGSTRGRTTGPDDGGRSLGCGVPKGGEPRPRQRLHDAPAPRRRRLELAGVLHRERRRRYVWDHGFALDDLPALHVFCLEEDVRLRRYVESLDEVALTESLAMSADFAAPRWLVLAHVVNHGTQHRSELARYLTECGRSPGDLELLDALELRWPGEVDGGS